LAQQEIFLTQKTSNPIRLRPTLRDQNVRGDEEDSFGGEEDSFEVSKISSVQHDEKEGEK